MKNETTKKQGGRYAWKLATKEVAYIAVFVALLIAIQLVLAVIPGVETVTLLFVCFAFCFGVRRSVISAVVFSLLRQFVFGFSPTVLILYLIYYPLLCLAFALLGKSKKRLLFMLPFAVLIACLLTASFTLLDDIITPLYYGFSQKATRVYFYYSLPVLCTQTVCAGITIAVGFIPICKAFQIIKNRL